MAHAFTESPFRCLAGVGTMNEVGRTPLPAPTGVQEKRGHVPAVQKTLRTLDCGGTTPLSLRVPLVPDALEFAHVLCLAPDGAESVAECRDGGSVVHGEPRRPTGPALGR